MRNVLLPAQHLDGAATRCQLCRSLPDCPCDLLQCATAALHTHAALLLADHVSVAKSAATVADALFALGQCTQALLHRKRASRIREAGLPPELPALACSKDGFAHMKLAQPRQRGTATRVRHGGCPALMLARTREALRIRRALLPAERLNVAHSELVTADMSVEVGDCAVVVPRVCMAQRMRCAPLQAPHLRIADTEQMPACALCQLGGYEEAVAHGSKALAMRQTLPSSRAINIACVEYQMSHALLVLGAVLGVGAQHLCEM